MSKVLNTAAYPVDLDDGRTLAPGETADKVDTDHPHQRALVLDGHLLVLEGMKPRVRQSDELAAATSSDDSEKE